jgi:glycogen synthase
VRDLARAIPRVLTQKPDVRFKFVGASEPDGGSGRPLVEVLAEELKAHRKSVEFTGKVPLAEIPQQMASVDIAVFPSHWENSPNVCLEAMSAGRGIVASSAGGMAEMLDGGRAGLLVPPKQPDKLAAAILQLLDNREERIRLGGLARQRLLTEYSAERIGSLMEQVYGEAIERRRELKPR